MYIAKQFHFFRTRAVGYANDILRSRRLIAELTHREFRSRHLGSALGLLWAFIHPTIMVALYYMVFNYALPAPGRVGGAPFLVWLLAGLIPWFIISDTIASSSSAITDNRFLVKKVVFTTSLLPIIRLLSNLPVHLFMVLAILGIFWSYGYPPSWHSLQVLYYLAALLALGLGWSLLVSAIVPFYKDMGQVVAVILQVAFWATPLIWNIENAKWKYRMYMYLLPTTYIVQGYRDSLVYHKWFWIHPVITAYYWAFTLALLAVGGFIFSRLRPHFGDVL